MTEQLGNWIYGIVGVSLLSAAALAITPKGRVYSVLRFVCALAMIFALLQPLLALDLSVYARNLAIYREDYAQLGISAQEDTDRLTRTIIEQECAAYILDKATALGLNISEAAVRVKWGDEGCWYPYEAYITTEESAGTARLGDAIEAELGIPAERQYWSRHEN